MSDFWREAVALATLDLALDLIAATPHLTYLC
jgi:hypothetical protein